jgi:predicted GIY-YIG superfamily endonuclease
MEKISGIYKIINKTNGKYYVGSSRNIEKRWNTHKRSLRKNNHHNEYLQRAWNKYGENAFDFVIVELIPKISLFNIEKRYLIEAETDRNSYNLTFYPCGGPQPDYVKKKMKRNHYLNNGGKNPMLGKTHSDKSKNLMRSKALGRPPSNKDTKIYTFLNLMTNEIFIGNKENFSLKAAVSIPNVSAFVRGKYHTSKGWIVKPSNHLDVSIRGFVS